MIKGKKESQEDMYENKITCIRAPAVRRLGMQAQDRPITSMP